MDTLSLAVAVAALAPYGDDKVIDADLQLSRFTGWSVSIESDRNRMAAHSAVEGTPLVTVYSRHSESQGGMNL